MENASKALIIAGAILLAILLISLGIMIFNQAQDTVNNSGMTQAEITTFNNKFLKYEGTQKGSNEVIASNADSSNPVVKVNGAGGGITTSDIDTTATYTVALEYNSNGRVANITYSTK